MKTKVIKADKIIFSQRKTFGLQINNEGLLIVRVPINTTNEKIEALLKRYDSWIKKKKEEVMKYKHQPKKYIDNENFMFLGKSYPLKITDDNKKLLYFEKDEFYLAKDAIPYGKDSFKIWYKQKTLEIVTKQVEFYANIMNLQYKKVKVTFAEKRWGSCSYKNNLNFSYRLAMAPIDVINYVVIHELAHILHKNHSHNFWETVKSIMPNYKIYSTWLRKKGYLLQL